MAEVTKFLMTDSTGQDIVEAIAGLNPNDAVRFSTQTLTEAQKAQARNNIGAVSEEEVDISGKMDKSNPVGTGSFSMNRKSDTYAAARSTTFGKNCTANSTEAFAEGDETIASNYGAHAEGKGTTASGRYSHAEGWNTEAVNDAGHAEGENTHAYGGQAHAEGYETVAGGQAAHAEGYYCTASGSYAHAEGYHTSAISGAHAEGSYTNASNSYAHAEGDHSVASGYISHAEGNYSTASASFSHAAGNYTIADCVSETTVGKYNATHSSDEDKPLFVVGNGADSDNRSDAFVIRQSGNVEVDGDIKAGNTSVTQLKNDLSQLSNEALDIKMLGWSVPKECPIQNYMDGDRKFHQRVGRVDLGSLNWSSSGDGSFFIATNLLPLSATTWGIDYLPNVYCSKYGNDAKWNNITTTISDKKCSSYSNQVRISDSSYTNASTFKTAMQGIYFYYELATEIVTNVDGNEAISTIQSMHNYSTTEHIVGTWINGKPIYERTWDLGSEVTLTYGDTWTYIPQISATDKEAIIGASIMNNSGTLFDIIMVNRDNSSGLVGINHTRSGNLTARYVTLRYTKITD